MKSAKDLWIAENKKGKIFKIKVWYNGADTWRDPDEIYIREEKYFDDVDNAIKYFENYIENRFFNPGEYKIKESILECCDLSSYGSVIELERVEIENGNKMD